jgi:alpha-beta hydrolase superfamily lysophospholipase
MSRLERFELQGNDNFPVACIKWSNPRNVRGVVQISHGLGEHMGRYAELAKVLVEDELVVYGNDHRGHGLTAKPTGTFGDFGPGGFDQLVEDMVSLRVIAQKENPVQTLHFVRTQHGFVRGATIYPRSQSFY